MALEKISTIESDEVGKVLETYDYGMFVAERRNRGGAPLSENHVRDLAEDFKVRGQIEPIIVRSSGKIVAGHHRLAAAEQAGKPVKYIVDDARTAEDVMKAHDLHKGWTLENLINFHTGGNYKKFRELATDRSLSYNSAALLLTGRKLTGSLRSLMINGDFVISPQMLLQFKSRWAKIEKLAKVRDGLFFEKITAVKTLEVLLVLVEHPDYSEQHLLGRLNAINESDIQNGNNQEQTALALELIYNKYVKGSVKFIGLRNEWVTRKRKKGL